MKEHCGSVEKNIGPILGRHRGDRITPAQIDAAYALWRKQGLSASSIRWQHSILSAAFGQAVKWGWVDRNPVKRASPPSVRRGEDRSMSTGDVRRLIETTGTLAMRNASAELGVSMKEALETAHDLDTGLLGRFAGVSGVEITKAPTDAEVEAAR